MGGDAQFYGFAALVIPVLLFGGAVSDRWTPHDRNAPGCVAAWVVIGAMLLAIAAELVAIYAAFTGRTSASGRVIVAFVVSGGTVAAAGAVTWPWRSSLGCLYPLIAAGAILAAIVWGIARFDLPTRRSLRRAVARLAHEMARTRAVLTRVAAQPPSSASASSSSIRR